MGKALKTATPVEIAGRIRRAREEAGLTQEALALRCGGVTRAAIALWEQTGEIKVQNLLMLAPALGVDLNYLVGSNSAKPGLKSPLADGVVPEMKGGIGVAGPAHLQTMPKLWRFNPAALESLGTSVDSVKIYRVGTNLMEPTINSGTYVMVDFSQTDVCDGQVFAIDNGIALTMSRIFIADSKTVEIAYDSRPNSRTKLPLKNCKVAGRVVAKVLQPL